MRTLIYVPIIHTSADLGSLAGEVTKRGIADLGHEFWEEHRKTVDGFWDAILNYFDLEEVKGIKIYQDGMVAEGEMGEKIVEEGGKSGSKNYELVSRLLKRGAILVRTEDFSLVKKELNRLHEITQAKSIGEKVVSFIKFKLTQDLLLNKRDSFIAKRINETLQSGEKGILFIGAYHNIKMHLAKDIHLKELKDVKKVREYHRLLPFYAKNKQRIKELGEYVTSPIPSKAE